MTTTQMFLSNFVELIFARTFSFFEIFGLLVVSEISIRQDSLWWMCLYIPVLVISIFVQKKFENNSTV